MLSGSTPVTLNVSNFTPNGAAQVWQLTSSNAITRLADVGVSSSTLATTVPPQSVTLFIVPAGSTTTNQPPTAAATAAPTNGTAPLQVAFDGSGSRDPDGSIVSYAWNFGDGSSANGVTATHTYSNANTYIATLTVTDNQGATGSNNVVITASSSSGGGGGDTVNAPSNLSGKISRSPPGVYLAWSDNSKNESEFYVERAVAGTGSFARIGQVPTNVASFFDTPGPGRFTYRVQAFNSSTGQASSYSNQITVRIR